MINILLGIANMTSLFLYQKLSSVIYHPEYIIIGLTQTESTLGKSSLQLSWMLAQIYKAICDLKERNKES